MKIITFLTAIAISFLLISCGGSSNHTTSSGSGINITPDQLSDVIDPVCKMSMENRAIADTATYNGKLYGFCNTGCKEAFRKNPEKYLDL